MGGREGEGERNRGEEGESKYLSTHGLNEGMRM